MIRKRVKVSVSAIAIILVQNLPAAGWFIFILRKICVPTLVQSAVRMNGIPTYKVRGNVEKSINHFKDSFCVAGRKTQNEKTLHADLLLAGITQLITVIVADKLHKHQYIRSLKPLIA